MTDQFKKLVEEAKRILITSHISPDPDAICSVLLLGRALALNFPDKQIKMVLEESSSQDVSFLADFNQIEQVSLKDTVESFKPDLFISVDAAGMQRLSRNDGQTLSDLIYNQLKSKVAVIDHHQMDDSVKTDVYIKSERPATTQEIYEILFEKWNLKKPENYAEAALLGIVRDTGRFKYDNPSHRQTFRIVSDLIDAGASIEKLEYRLDRYSLDELLVLSNLLHNSVVERTGYSYSFIDDEFSKQWQAQGKSTGAYKAATDVFSSLFLRNIEDAFWGFIVYPELQAADRSYSVSFRAVSGGIDVARIAARLEGGGHKQAAGAKNIVADSVQEAVNKVEQTIEKLGLIK